MLVGGYVYWQSIEWRLKWRKMLGGSKVDEVRRGFLVL